MAGMPHYPQDLRAIGQALEILRVEHFEIEPEGETYLVQAVTERPSGRGAGGPTGERTIRYIWNVAPEGTPANKIDRKLLYAIAKTLNLHYTPADVARLAEKWQAKRNNPNGMADPANLSELLRAVGGYLGEKGVYLEKIRRQQKTFVLQYQDDAGQKREEILSEYDLQQLSARMLAKRGGGKVLALEEL